MYISKIFILLLSFWLAHSEDVESEEDDWPGKWFPKPPNSLEVIKTDTETPVHRIHNILMGIKDAKCDNGNDSLATDFDPSSETDKLLYTCLDNEIKYAPSNIVHPLLREYIVPPSYTPLHKCLNESVTYNTRLPTYGSHRPNWPKYGEYTYVPIQRWLHNVEHGAVVMIYHPCTNREQVDILKKILKECLFRHIITPSLRLLPERPLALIVWGKSLEMSIIDPIIVIDFIKSNALRGPEKISKDGQYDKLLIENAKIISDKEDSNICPQY